TPYMVLLAALDALFARYTGASEVVIGSAVAGRSRAEAIGLVGFFANTLVLRVDVSGDPSFRALLARVRRAALDAYAHQDVPFDRLVEELQPTRDASGQPLCRVMFTFQNASGTSWTLPNLEWETLGTARGAQFDLNISAAEDGDAIALTVEYAAELF